MMVDAATGALAVLKAVDLTEDRVWVTFVDGTHADLAAVWLRDHLPDPSVMDPGNGQRLVDVLDLPWPVTVRRALVRDNALWVTFGPDGKEGRFGADWLWRYGVNGGGDPGPAPQPWRDGSEPLTQAPLSTLQREHAALLHWLTGLLRDGATLVTDVPGESGAVEEVVGLFGHVWETNYGRLFDVRTEADPNNLAFTSRALPPHTDNPYRDPVPSLQVLHCLTDDGAGGDTVLVDGFFVAEQLREKDVDAFRWLTRPVTFRYRAGNAHLENRVPVIDVDDNDALRAVHVNHRSFHPVELSAEEQGPYYEAYRWFHQLLQAPDTGRRFHLAPGQAMVFHNHRLLHARTALAATGARHLQGCYAHHHEALSTWRILNAAVKGDLHGQ